MKSVVTKLYQKIIIKTYKISKKISEVIFKKLKFSSTYSTVQISKFEKIKGTANLGFKG